jgi:hypothetical protein
MVHLSSRCAVSAARSSAAFLQVQKVTKPDVYSSRMLLTCPDTSQKPRKPSSRIVLWFCSPPLKFQLAFFAKRECE